MQVLLPLQSGCCELERLALLPADPASDGEALVAALARGGDDLLEMLLRFDLGAIWHAGMSTSESWSTLPGSQRQRLEKARLMATARYLAQRDALAQADAVFDSAGIPYAVMKGVLVRERLHSDPSVMFAGDIDVLISRKDRDRAASLLTAAGFKIYLNPVNISHEVTFCTPSADVDLHWNMLRPGRTRVELTDLFLSRRVRGSGFWGLCDSDSTFVMLTHPAFAKYICSPNMGLSRVLAFLLWSRTMAPHLPAVAQLLDQAGLKTAAWAMLGWYMAWAPTALQPPLAQLRDSVRPGRLRSSYLELWLRHNLATRLIDHPLPIQLGLTTFLHDTPSDALIAWRGWYSSRRSRHQDANAFLAIGDA